uniref:Uncharacterized protein n=2 Tax=Lutzomyia longipalpis TaxID=7200 RepID=A0A1B0CH87_LUTLO
MKKFQNEFEASKRELLDGKYLEYDPEWKKLFTWLRDSITIDNYVSPSIEENVKNHEFDDEIDTIEEDFPGIFEVEESDVKEAEAQLNILLKAEGEYREQNDQLRKIINQVNEDIREISKELTDTYAQAEIWGEKVAGLEAQLDTLTAQKDDSEKKLMEMYKNPEEVLAVGHIPIDYLKMNMEIAWKRLGTCMAAFNTEGSALDGQRLNQDT